MRLPDLSDLFLSMTLTDDAHGVMQIVNFKRSNRKSKVIKPPVLVGYLNLGYVT